MSWSVKPTSASTSGLLLVAAAAALWGTIGLFFKALLGYGLTPLSLAFLRALLTFVILLGGLGVLHPARLRLARRDIPYFLLFGAISVGVFYVVYIVAVDLTSVATAAVLLYTAPAWVTLLAWRLYGEPLGARQLVALGLAFAGCALVAGAYDPAQLRVNAVGVLAGLAAGLTYALYSIFSVPALRRYSSWTVVTWAVGCGALALTPLVLFQEAAAFAPILTPSAAWLWLLGLALGPTVGALVLYTTGLQSVPAGVASVTATLEPVVATLLAVIVLGERLTPPQLLGGALIVGAVAMLAGRKR